LWRNKLTNKIADPASHNESTNRISERVVIDRVHSRPALAAESRTIAPPRAVMTGAVMDARSVVEFFSTSLRSMPALDPSLLATHAVESIHNHWRHDIGQYVKRLGVAATQFNASPLPF